jgi:nucleotide-binding universal stress UspA family protein
MSNALTAGEDSLTAARVGRLLGRLTRRDVVRHEEVFVMKILLAVDGSPFSEEAAAEVARRPWPTGSEVRVVYVVETPPPPPPEMWAGSYEDYFGELTLMLRSQARQALESATRILDAREDKTLRVTAEMLEGQPKRVIPEEAESWGADLVVLGSHGYGFWDRLLLGSVSQAVASHAPCSVEIVRRHERAEGAES